VNKNLCFIVLFQFLLLGSCRTNTTTSQNLKENLLPEQFVVLLGIAQDAGYPQLGCEKDCCTAYWKGEEAKKHVTSLALVDRTTNQYWLFEATPDIRKQLQTVQGYISNKPDYNPDGIFISHAHIGHYTGLMQLGREVMGAKEIPVWAMPRLDSFFRNNGPWSQLVSLNNIRLHQLANDSTISINGNLKITPLQVPHRDEFSETVGIVIESKKKKILFIPDIDKWEKWNRQILDEIAKVDFALLDGTFYMNGELPGRDMREVPHPFVEESMQLFSTLPDSLRSKIMFIHFNHTNPLIKKSSPEKIKVKKAGFDVAEEGKLIAL